MRTEVGDWPVVFRASTRPKNSESERNLSPSETKRFAGWVVSHWHHYMRRINDFAGFVCFQGLNRLFVSHFFRIRSRAQTGLSPAIDAVACLARESGHPARLWRDLDSRLRGNDKTPGAIPSEHALLWRPDGLDMSVSALIAIPVIGFTDCAGRSARTAD